MRVSLPQKLTRYQLPKGYAGTVATLRQMSAIAREEHADPRIRARMRELLVNVDTMDDLAVVAAVWRWIIDHVKYARDVALWEHVTTPTRLDLEIDEAAAGLGAAIEDCESVALYAATLFASIGILSAFEIQAKNPSRPSVFTHCALRVRLPRSGELLSFDPVGAYYYPDTFGLGDTAARPGERVELWGALDGKKLEDGMSGLRDAMFGDTESTVFSVLDAAKGVLPLFGPYGQIAGGVIQTAEGIYDASTGKKYGLPPGGAPINVTTGQPAPARGVAPPGLARLRGKLSAPAVAKAIGKTITVGPPPPAHGATGATGGTVDTRNAKPATPIGKSGASSSAGPLVATGAGLSLAWLLSRVL